MSRTDKDAPYRVRARDSHMREEWHVWCDNETVDTASPWKYGRFARRAEYEFYVSEVMTVECSYVKMKDSRGVKFEARILPYDRHGDGLEYDRELHPNAKYVYTYERYAGELIACRQIRQGYYDRPIYRSRLIGWVDEPIRECDIDDPNGVCYYYAWGIHYTHPKNRELRRVVDEKPRRAEVRDVLNSAKYDYNTHGETDIEPEPGWSSRAWW